MKAIYKDFFQLMEKSYQVGNLSPISSYWKYMQRLFCELDLAFGIWEPYQTKLFKKVCKPGLKVADIGAYIGHYTLIASKLVGDRGKVYSFEPDPRNFEILKRNVKAHEGNNVVLIQKAVTDRQGKIDFFLANNSRKSNLVKGKHRTIQSTTLDKYFKDKEVDLIKLDVEGSELKILQEGSRILERNIKLFVELHPKALKVQGDSSSELLNELKEKDFKIYSINRFELRKIRSIKDVKPLNVDHLNLYCICN